MNALKPHLRNAVQTLLRGGKSQREVARQTGVHRTTIRAIAAKCSGAAAGSENDTIENVPPRPPGPRTTESTCEVHREFIEAQLALGRNATAIYQDLVDDHGFAGKYNAVKRFVHKLKARDPERFDVLEFLPGEESQVDYGQGAPTRHPTTGKYKRPYLFVMTLKFSGKSFRKTVWKTSQQVWAHLHEEAWRSFGGCCQYNVLDNLKEGVIEPSIYEPRLNPVYAAMLEHYDVVADPCRVRDPNRKGTVESAVKHTQSTALQGRRFESIEEQNDFLARWEERWAAPRIHGTKKRQVLEMFNEERPHLKALPLTPFRYFRQEVRTVNDYGMVQIDSSSYSALPAPLYSEVVIRVYERDIEILDSAGRLLQRHEKSARKGANAVSDEDRIYNPSRETQRHLSQLAKIGPHAAKLGETMVATLGRPGQKQVYGLVNLAKTYRGEDIETVAQIAVEKDCLSYRMVKRALDHRAAAAPAPTALAQSGPDIRSIDEYQEFFDTHTQEDEAE
jgi:transposase